MKKEPQGGSPWFSIICLGLAVILLAAKIILMQGK